MYTLNRHYAQDIDSDTAQRWIDKRDTYLGQRNFRTRHCNELAAKMADKRFMRGFIVFGVMPDDSLVLANGQHQLHAVVRSGVTINANVEEYRCDSPGDLYALFTQIDQGKARTQADVLRASRGNLDNALRLMPTSFLGQAGAAIYMALRTPEPLFLSREVSPHLRADVARRHSDLVMFMEKYAHMAAAKRLPVLMAMAAIRRVDARRAEFFWDMVVDGSASLPAGDPRAQLRSLMLLPAKRGASTATAVREYYSKCILHWNAHATGGAIEAYDPGAATVRPVAATAPAPVLATVTNPRPATLAPAAFPILRTASPAVGAPVNA